MKTSVIIVTYNRLELLRECLSCVRDNLDLISNVFVINNNSNDGTTDYLNSIKDNIVIPVNLKENIGGAGGFSYGLKYAYENSDSDYFLIMDDDTMIQDSTLPKLYMAAEKLNYNFGFLSSNVRWYKKDQPSYLNIPIPSKDWNAKSDCGLVKLTSASFVSFFVSRQVVKKLGLPIKEMFIWADDVEYSTRISSKFDSYYVPDSKVIHKCKSNDYGDSIVNCEDRRIFYYQCMFRNRIYIYRKYYGYKYAFLHTIKYLSIVFLIPFKSKNYRLKRIKSILYGVFNGFKFNPSIIFPK